MAFEMDDLLCGLFHVLNDSYVPVPLKNVSLNIKIVDFIAEVEILQEYVNQESTPIEVRYSYPIEEYATINGFEANIDGHEIVAEVKAKIEAEREYQKAVKTGNSAILLAEKSPDIFSMKLGQLKPGSGAMIKLTYIMELPAEDKYTSLTIPTTIAPRYIPANDTSETAMGIAEIEYNDVENPKIPLNISILTLMKSKIKKIFSPTHETLQSEISENVSTEGFFEAKTYLNGITEVMDRDLVLLIQSDNDKPVLMLEKSEDSIMAMLSFVPNLQSKDSKTELVFLVDCSGSMWDSIGQAKQALKLFLHSLPADCYFNIWRFGSTYSSLFFTSQKYDDWTLEKAKKHVEDLDADLGGTEIYHPLEHILYQKSIREYPKQVILLTDGAVSNADQVIKLVRRHPGSRVFTLGLGFAASRHLVKGVARAGNGLAAFASTNEDLKPKVMTLLKNALLPMTKTEILWDGVSDKTLDRYDKPIFDQSRMLHFKKFLAPKIPQNVKLIVHTTSGPWSFELPIEKKCYVQTGSKFLHQLSARRTIRNAEETGKFYDSDDEEDMKNLAIKHGIASKFTSFVGVDKNTRKTAFEPAMISRCVKHELPRAYLSQSRSRSRSRNGIRDRSISRDRSRSRSRSRDRCRPRFRGTNRSIRGCPWIRNRSSSTESRSNSRDSSPSGSMVDATQPLDKLIALQTANGSFKYGAAFGVSEELLKLKLPKNEPWNVFITAFALTMLERKFFKSKSLWELVAKKSKLFLEANFKGEMQNYLKSVSELYKNLV